MVAYRVFEKSGKFLEMAELKENKQKNGKLSLRPLKFEEAVKDLLKVKPEVKRKDTIARIIMVKESEK